MQIKDLKKNDLVIFSFHGKNVKGIFDKIDKFGHPVFFITDMGYENQAFQDIDNIDVLERPVINDYSYVKECIAEDKIRLLKLRIDLAKENIKKFKSGDFVPFINDVINFVDPYD